MLVGGAAPALLLLDAGALPQPRRHLLHAAYQHLYQEAGYTGYAHEAAQAGQQAKGQAAERRCEAETLQPLCLGFMHAQLP